jgi:hypothetical protein
MQEVSLRGAYTRYCPRDLMFDIGALVRERVKYVPILGALFFNKHMGVPEPSALNLRTYLFNRMHSARVTFHLLLMSYLLCMR